MLHFGTAWVAAWAKSYNTNEWIATQAVRTDHEGQSHAQSEDTKDKDQCAMAPFYKALQVVT